MNIDIDDRMKSNYLENPNLCPFCGSDQLTVVGRKQIEGKIMIKVQCEHCHIHWIEEYELIDIKNARIG